MPALQISRSSIVVASEGNISCDLAGEVAVLDFKSGMYYGLDEIGARIWKLITEPRAVNDICDMLVAEYEVESGVCERDVLALLGELAAKGLVETRDDVSR
ncbi:MAG: PqqD family peptide modification chaperone [Candidatus Binataceae bacterium]